MGKGDKKTVRGKIIMGSYGAKRQKKRTTTFIPASVKEAKMTDEIPKKTKPVSEKPSKKKEEVQTIEKPVAVKVEKVAAEKVEKVAAEKPNEIEKKPVVKKKAAEKPPKEEKSE